MIINQYPYGYDPTKTYPYDYFIYPRPIQPSQPWIWPVPSDVKTTPSTVPFDWTNIKLSGYQITDKKIWDRYPNSWVVERKRTEDMEQFPERYATLPMKTLYILIPYVSHDRLHVVQEEQLLYVRISGTSIETLERDFKTPFATERKNAKLSKMMEILDKNHLSNGEYVFDLDRTYEVLRTKLERGILEIEFSQRNPKETFKQEFKVG